MDVQHHDDGRGLGKMVLQLVADPEFHDVPPRSGPMIGAGATGAGRMARTDEAFGDRRPILRRVEFCSTSSKRMKRRQSAGLRMFEPPPVQSQLLWLGFAFSPAPICLRSRGPARSGRCGKTRGTWTGKVLLDAEDEFWWRAAGVPAAYCRSSPFRPARSNGRPSRSRSSTASPRAPATTSSCACTRRRWRRTSGSRWCSTTSLAPAATSPPNSCRRRRPTATRC